MPVVRDRTTLSIYFANGILGYLVNGIGPVLPFLQDEFGISRAEVALYPATYAVGLIVVGAVGTRVFGAWERRRLFRWAIAALGLAGLLLALAVHALVPGVGAALLGLSGAILVTVGQGALADRHGAAVITTLAESNAFGSVGAISAPLAIGLTVGIGLGWQPGLAIVPILAVGALLALGSFELSQSSDDLSARAQALSTPLLPWFGVVLAVAIEFSFVFWASDYLFNIGGFDSGVAASMTATFFIGMVIGRGTAARLSRLLSRPRPAILAALSLVIVGFIFFWLGPRMAGSIVLAGLGLLIAGLGVANLLPLTVGRMLALSEGPADRISARSVLAIGTAIALAPPLLGWLADEFGLTNALLMIPALVVIALAIGWVTGRDQTD